jgi:predicted type IV restriction endonuclease
MNNYSEVLAPLVEKIKKFRDFYKQNEMANKDVIIKTAIRDYIINPILKDLGWDPENPEEVQPNVFTKGDVPGYVLLKNGEKILFIEVKSLNDDIKQKEAFQQLANYSSNKGVKYSVLTNGLIWILIRTFEEGTTSRGQIIWEADLENEELLAAYRKIVTLSKTNIENIEVLTRKAQILDEIWQSLINKPEEIIKGLIPVVKSIIGQSYKDYQFKDTEIKSLLEEKIKKIVLGKSEEEAPTETLVEFTSWQEEIPRKMKLGNKVFEIDNVYKILVNTANWLIDNGKIKPYDYPIKTGYKRYLINNQPKHKDGKDFIKPIELSNGLWIEANHDTGSSIHYAVFLLKKFGALSEFKIIIK